MATGFGFPLGVNPDGSIVPDPDENADLRGKIIQVLFTNPGERVNRPDFGSGLQQLIFAPNSPELAATLQFTLQAALQRWLGDVIQVQSLQVVNEDSKLSITVQYLVRQTQVQQVAQFTQGGSGT